MSNIETMVRKNFDSRNLRPLELSGSQPDFIGAILHAVQEFSAAGTANGVYGCGFAPDSREEGQVAAENADKASIATLLDVRSKAHSGA
ncbi:MAG TPA: hypothetical protein VJT49_26045 [Amycolatopsis sp.]|uniref:hypothetical protein n=1 Tax=Amycolatopsis sp. TaxID=37632 RepID=UPI002B475CC6|nr:hypothetical protein [Amycolatopsis sp.]HKS48510.1 hypothetical protein [Amycolatopsis sp.]